jgi:hypothetical protein
LLEGRWGKGGRLTRSEFMARTASLCLQREGGAVK